jgi:hypothetical protein
MFSKNLALALVGLVFFLTTVAFILGKPKPKDKRLYPIIKKYMPFKVENGLGGLKILRKDDPSFKEEPDAVNFYHTLQALEQEWAKKHLKISNNKLKILDENGKTIKEIELKNKKEFEFIHKYFGVK